MQEPQERRTNPVLVTLQGGVLDGDTFELLPQGSVLPPLRLSYAYRDRFPILAKSGVNGKRCSQQANL